MNQRLLALAAGAIIAFMAPALTNAALTDYTVVVTSGSKLTPATMTTLASGGRGQRFSSSNYNRVYAVDLPFTFYFDGGAYTRVSISTNGVMGLGFSNITTSSSNNLTTTSTIFPRLAPFWDLMQLPGGATRYCSSVSSTLKHGITGTAPNRIFVADWTNFALSTYTLGLVSFQVRLYEGSNRVEFYYTDMGGCAPSCVSWRGCTSSSASIGVAASSSNYISILPSGASATVSRSSVYNSTNVRTNTITSGTLYQIQPCTIDLAGNQSQGGTASMANGDTLLKGRSVQRGNTQDFYPLTITNPVTGCGTRIYTLSVSGPNAADFQVTPSSGAINQGEFVNPAVTFTPGGIGVRTATLRVSDNNNFVRTYVLSATGAPRIGWIGNIADGGTLGMLDSDTLMSTIDVTRLTWRDLSPMTLRNVNGNGAAPPAQVTLTLDSFGVASTQYTLQSSPTASLTSGQVYTPVIRFQGTGVGPQTARLVVNADGEVRTFVLRAISGAPAIEVLAAGQPADESNPVFNGVTSCVGEFATSVPFVVRNWGTRPLVIDALTYLKTDTVVGQGPALPLLRDAQGNVIGSGEYVITESAGVAPIAANVPVGLPFTVAPGTSRSLYLTYVADRPGKRAARLFLSSNGENRSGVDPQGNTDVGLVAIDLIGRAIASQLAGDLAGGAITPAVLANTRVRDTSFTTFTIANPGQCELRLSRNAMQIASGDMNEFRLVRVLPHTPTDANGDYIIAPGSIDTVGVRFIPGRSGSRSVSIRLQTNDSLIGVDGVSERGALYIDVHGRGIAGLDAREVVLNPVAIGSSTTGTVYFENTTTAAEQVSALLLMDGQSSEFSIENAPALPARVLAGDRLPITVRLTPVGAPGLRATYLALVTGSGDTITALVRGEAGTQQLVVAPNALFENVAIGIGEAVRRQVLITNNGTLPLRLESVEITGADKGNYRMGAMPRYDIDPGATEYLEITFAPSAQGQSMAQLDVTYNGATTSVALGGTALRARGGDPTTGTIGSADGAGYRTPEDLNATSGTGRGSAAVSVASMTAQPNPTSTATRIDYAVTTASDVRIELFDARGVLIRTLVDAPRQAGRHSALLDVTSLPEGTYRIALSAGATRLSQPIVVVR